MKNKRMLVWAAIAVCLLLILSGSKLAQPELNGPDRDKFIGFHIVPEKMGAADDEGFQQIGDNDRTHWVEYGTETIPIEGFGNATFKKQILIGTYNEEEHRYEFPGKEGFNCTISL